MGDYPYGYTMYTSPGEYLLTFMEGGETPTTPSGRRYSQSWLLAPFYDGYDIIWCYG